MHGIEVQPYTGPASAELGVTHYIRMDPDPVTGKPPIDFLRVGECFCGGAGEPILEVVAPIREMVENPTHLLPRGKNHCERYIYLVRELKVW